MAMPAQKTDKDKPSRPSPPLWRLVFDAVERPVGAASESWVQSEVFMDALAVAWKLQRRAARELQRGLGMWLSVWGVPQRSDMTALVNQVAGLERQLRQVTRDLDRRDGSAIAEQRPAATARKSSANGGKR
jgi:hypothetical protein